MAFKRNGPGCCACKSGCANSTLCWQVAATCGADLSTPAAAFRATVVGPDGRPVAPTITASPGAVRVCVPVGGLGTYTLRVTSTVSLDHSEATAVPKCASAIVPVSVRGRALTVSVLGCNGNPVPGATVAVDNGFASASATTGADGVARLAVAGREWPDSATWTASAAADGLHYAPTSGRFASGPCAFTLHLAPADCFTCDGAQCGPGPACPHPIPTSGTLTTPFGAVCVTLGVPLMGMLTGNAVGFPEHIGGPGFDTTCAQPTRQISFPVDVLVGGAGGQGGAGCLFVGAPSCAGGGCLTPRSGRGGTTTPAIQIQLRTTSQACGPYTLSGTYTAPASCPGQAWANGSYTFTGDGCGCSGSYGSYGAGAPPALAFAAEPPPADPLGRPDDLAAELVVARYNEDALWAEALA